MTFAENPGTGGRRNEISVVTVPKLREMETVLALQHGLSPRPIAPPPATQNGLLARVGGSQEVLYEVIGLFLEDCPKLLTTIGDAIAKGDSDAVYRAAHTLKGSAGNFDAHYAVLLLQRLEARAREGDLMEAQDICKTLSVEITALLSMLERTRGALPCAS